MPTSPRPLLRTLLWAAPAAFLAWTGISKLVAPEGTTPRALTALLEVAPWTTWLRVMGALELGVAALLAWPRTRVVGTYAAFVLVAALTGLVAFNADDTRFVADCGCLGGLRPAGRGISEVHVLLLRNAALLFVLAFGAFLAHERLTAGAAAARGGIVAVGILLAAAFAAEHVKGIDAREALEVAQKGRSLAAWVGWRLPPLLVLDAQGNLGPLADHVRPHDRLLVLSTTCQHCAASGPGVQAVAGAGAAANGGGARVLLLVVEEDGPPAATWLPAHGYGGLPYVRLREARDARRLGLDSVPGWIVLDQASRVAQHHEHGGLPSLLDDLERAGPLAAGLAETVWERTARAVAGPDAKVGAPRREGEGWEAGLGDPPGSQGRLFVRAAGKQRAYALELAMGLGPDGRLLGVVPLASGSHVPWLAADVAPALADLKGLTPAEALAKALERAKPGRLSAATWWAVYLALEGLPGARPQALPPLR